MLEQKILEIRDRATRIDVLATRLTPEVGSINYNVEKHYISHAGWGNAMIVHPDVMITIMESGKTQYDPFKWGDNPRTMFDAHRYIRDNWNKIPNYWVVDVESIHNEKSTMKVPERYDHKPYIQIYCNGMTWDDVTDTMDLDLHMMRILKKYDMEPSLYASDPWITDSAIYNRIKITTDQVVRLGIKFYDMLLELDGTIEEEGVL